MKILLNKMLLKQRVNRKGSRSQVAEAAGVSLQTLNRMIDRGYLPTIKIMEKLFSHLNLEIGDVLINEPKRLIPSKKKIHVYIGARRQDPRDPTATPELSVADVEAAWYFLFNQISHTRNVNLKLLMQNDAAEKTQVHWNQDQHEKNFVVVIGSLRINSVFDCAYEELCAHFGTYELHFCWRPGTESISKLMEVGVEKGYATVNDDKATWGVHCKRKKCFISRETNPQVPNQGFRDISIVTATEKSLMVFGHGPAGTLGAAHLLVEHWSRIEKLVQEHRAVILLSPVIVKCDADKRPISVSFEGQPLTVLTPKERPRWDR